MTKCHAEKKQLSIVSCLSRPDDEDMNAMTTPTPHHSSRPARRIVHSLGQALRRDRDSLPGIDRNALPSEQAIRSINEITPRA